MALVGLFGSIIVVEFLLERLNNLDLSLINSIHSKTRNIRHKKIVQCGLIFLLGAIVLSIDAKLHLSVVSNGIIMGIIWAVIAFCFEDTFFDSLRNTLR